MKPAVLIIGGAEVGAGKVKWAKQQGLHVVVVDRNPQAPGILLADSQVIADRNDLFDILSQAMLLADKLKFRGIYCGIDLGVTPTVVAHALGVPAISIRSAVISQHKWLMKKYWMENGVPTPPGYICRSEAEIRNVAGKFGYPFVLKALNSSGSQGIYRIDKESDISKGLTEVGGFSKSSEFIAEQWVSGSMHDINGLFWNQRFYPCGVMDRYFLPGPDCMSAYTIDPTELDEYKQESAYKLLEKAAHALGITEGPVKGDFVWSDQGPMMLEIAPRFHGDIQTVQTSPLGPGINALKGYFKALAKGEVDPAILRKTSNYCAGWKTIPASPGCVAQIKGVKEAMRIPGVERVFVYREVGQTIGALTNNSQIPGVVVARAENRKKLDEIFNQAFKVIDIITR